jgi:predicted aspartyl protease
MEKTQSTPSTEATILNDETTRAATVERLQDHLPIDACGYKANNKVILEIITHAAVTGRSTHASCQDLDVDISSNTVREQLNAQLSVGNLDTRFTGHFELEASVNGALHDGLPRKARRAAAEVAVVPALAGA